MSSYRHHTDLQLTELLRQGDHMAFTEIYYRYWENLINTAYQRLKSIEAAEDVVQSVFVSLYLRKEEFYPQSSLEAYLKTALKYKVFNIYRAQQTHYTHLASLVENNHIQPAQPDDTVELKELHDQMDQIISTLPEKCQEVFRMSRFNHLSHHDIAQKMNISVSTVKKHIHKALQVLRNALEGNQ